MKTRLLTAVAFSLALPSTILAAQEKFQITERGFDHRVWTRQVVDVLPSGEWITNTHSFVELQDGLHYRAGDQWLESKAEIEIFNGGAVARQTPFQIIFSPQINVQGAIDVLSPQGQRFLTTPRWLNFHDRATGKDAMVSEIKDSIGELAEPSVLVFPDCWTDCKASLRITLSRTGYESDVVLADEGFGVPEDYGLNSATTQLEVWHEFFEAPTPKKISRATAGGEVDQTLDFSDMRIGPGQAFALNRVGESIDVHKSWMVLDGRRFLVEAVPYSRLRPLLDKLNKQARAVAPELKVKRMAKAVAGRERLVRGMAALPKKQEKSLQVASIKPGKPLVPPGVVLDYTALSINKTDYTFLGDTTYYISGQVGLYGTNTTFEAGTVLKYANSGQARLNVYTPVDFQGTPYRPVVLTAKDDQSVGEAVTANSLSGFYADTALYLDAATAATNFTLQNLRITYATNAISINGRSNHVFSHVQMVNCMTGIRATNTTFALRNALFDRVYTNFTGSSATGRVEHLTVDTASHLNFNSNLGLWLTNCLLVAVTNAGSYTANCVSNLSDPTGVFQTVGSGSHYLANNSLHRDVGVAGIDPTLASALKKLTTYPPIVRASNFTVTTTLSPAAQRDVDTQDLGWHYDPLDYCWSGLLLTNATLLLTNGVAIGIYGDTGTTLQSSGKFISQGTPQALNRVVRSHAVQEQPSAWGTDAGSARSLVNVTTLLSGWPELRLRFTDVSLMADSNTRRYILDGASSPSASNVLSTVVFRDCQLRGGYLNILTTVSNMMQSMTVALTNNLAQRAEFSFVQGYQGSGYPLYLYLRNNLFLNSTVSLTYYSTLWPWGVYDNFFDTVALTTSGALNIPNSNNGYRSTTTMAGSSGGDKTITVSDYQTAALGRFYYPSSGGASSGLTNLINNGSRNSTNAGLFHFTTTANLAKETNSIVDIGYHYVATDGNGNPLDGDGDGMPDFEEDANGNGSFDASGGETDWKTFESSFGLSGNPGLSIFTPLK